MTLSLPRSGRGADRGLRASRAMRGSGAGVPGDQAPVCCVRAQWPRASRSVWPSHSVLHLHAGAAPPPCAAVTGTQSGQRAEGKHSSSARGPPALTVWPVTRAQARRAGLGAIRKKVPQGPVGGGGARNGTKRGQNPGLIQQWVTGSAHTCASAYEWDEGGWGRGHPLGFLSRFHPIPRALGWLCPGRGAGGRLQTPGVRALSPRPWSPGCCFPTAGSGSLRPTSCTSEPAQVLPERGPAPHASLQGPCVLRVPSRPGRRAEALGQRLILGLRTSWTREGGAAFVLDARRLPATPGLGRHQGWGLCSVPLRA